MIDTYFDRADRATGYKPTPMQPVNYDDPRYWGGQLYATVIDCNVARAKATLRWELTTDVTDHRIEMRHGIKLGSVHSVFTATGTRKN